MRWFMNREKPIGPPPPVQMSDADFREAQRRYIEKHDKLVKPDHALAVELLKLGTEYGKMTVTYLTLGNGGGLAALVVIHPLLRDANATWLAQQFWVAVAFAAGLFLAATTGAIAYLSFMGGAVTRWNIAHHNAIWISRAEFGSDRHWADQVMADHFRRWKNADRISMIMTYIALVLAVGSALCWSIGAVLLAKNIMATLTIT